MTTSKSYDFPNLLTQVGSFVSYRARPASVLGIWLLSAVSGHCFSSPGGRIDWDCNLAYNYAGQLVSESYSGGPLDGVVVTNTSDPLLRRTNLALKSQSSTLTSVAYAFDGASRLQSVSDGASSATYSYLANSPLVSQIAVTNNGQWRMSTSKSYDFLNRLTRISSVPSASSVVSFSYSYNDGNQRVRSTLQDGAYWSYEYDALGQVRSGKKYWADGTPVAGQQFEYGFDDIGNRTSTKAGGDENGANLRSATYGANFVNQYTNRTVPGAVDIMGVALATSTVSVAGEAAYRKGEYFRKELAVDNSISAVWTNITVTATGQSSVSGHAYVPATPESFSYDWDGNLADDGRWHYTWDGENRLVAVEPSWYVAVPEEAKLKLEFAYDWQGRRISKVVYTNNNGNYTASYTNRFVYDGWNLIATLTSDLRLLTSFSWGTDLSGTLQGAGGVGSLLGVSYHGTQTTNCFAAFDGNGNVTGLINAADGGTAAQYEYGPFGEVLRATGPMAKANPIRWSTKYTDDETDLVMYLRRPYSSSLGRWLSRDPVDEQGGKNLYGFLNNSPVDRVDFLGLWDTRVHRDGTRRWAVDAGYPGEAAARVSDADEAVDAKTGPTSYITEPGTQYHFNRSLSMGTGRDTRMIKYDEHMAKAKAFCTAARGFDYPFVAAWELGTALHPLQDWMAHGEHNYYLRGSFRLWPTYIHNYISPERNSTSFPDDPDMDAVGGADGRPDLNALILVAYDGQTFDYALYMPGQSRVRKTHSMTTSSLSEFREYVRANGGCACKKYFGVQ